MKLILLDFIKVNRSSWFTCVSECFDILQAVIQRILNIRPIIRSETVDSYCACSWVVSARWWNTWDSAHWTPAANSVWIEAGWDISIATICSVNTIADIDFTWLIEGTISLVRSQDNMTVLSNTNNSRSSISSCEGIISQWWVRASIVWSTSCSK